MDTILTNLKIDKAVNLTVGVSIALILLINQSLISVADDINNGAYTGITPTINFIIEEQNREEIKFNKEIKQKYANANITDIEKGIKHIKTVRYYNNQPVRINIVELSTKVNNDITVEPTIASNKLASKNKISNIAKREQAIVAINGGFFKPQTGVPLGTLMIDKKVYTGPIYDRVALGIFDNGYEMSRLKLNANLDTNIGGLKIDNVNQPRMLSTHTIVYTPDWGEVTPKTPKYGAQLVVDNDKIIGILEHSTTIPKNGYVIIGPKKKIELIKDAKKLKLNLNIKPHWHDVKHIISGGPYLVKNGDIYVDMTAQKLTAIGGRNPRTAIGYTKNGNLIMLTADGRENSSIGLTLMELASLMKEFGCINAMNLDGGGSTVMYVNGKIVNKPAIQGGIPLSHTLTVAYKNLS